MADLRSSRLLKNAWGGFRSVIPFMYSAKLYHRGYVHIENRNGLLVDARGANLTSRQFRTTWSMRSMARLRLFDPVWRKG